MTTCDPIELLFGGMEQLGPGSDEDTIHVLKMLPDRGFQTIVDAGCGTGRQTFALAQHLSTQIHAVDSYALFLDELAQRAVEKRIDHLVQTYCFDMKDIPGKFPRVDLLWSEGAAYNMGFANALETWAQAIPRSGFAVVSELSWLSSRIPQTVQEFFDVDYPEMQTIEENIAAAERVGYRLFGTHELPAEAWVSGYYDVLEPRAASLATHADSMVREFAASTLQEIEIFRRSQGSYGYVFYLLERV